MPSSRMRRFNASRAAATAIIDEIDAVSITTPSNDVGQAHHLPQPIQHDLFEFSGRRRGAPQHAVDVEARREQLTQDAGHRSRNAEIGHKSRLIPMRDAGHDNVVEIGEHIVERFGVRGRRHWQLRFHVTRLHTRQHRISIVVLQIIGDPIDELFAVFTEVVGVHVAKVRFGHKSSLI